MNTLDWRYQDSPSESWIARTALGRFEIRAMTCSYAFIEHDKIRHMVQWHAARSLKDAKERCEMLHRNADDQESARTVAVRPERS